MTKQSLESSVQHAIARLLPPSRVAGTTTGGEGSEEPRNQTRRGPLADQQLCGPQERLAGDETYLFVAHRPGLNPEAIAGMQNHHLRSTPSKENDRSTNQLPPTLSRTRRAPVSTDAAAKADDSRDPLLYKSFQLLLDTGGDAVETRTRLEEQKLQKICHHRRPADRSGRPEIHRSEQAEEDAIPVPFIVAWTYLELND